MKMTQPFYLAFNPLLYGSTLHRYTGKWDGFILQARLSCEKILGGILLPFGWSNVVMAARVCVCVCGWRGHQIFSMKFSFLLKRQLLAEGLLVEKIYCCIFYKQRCSLFMNTNEEVYFSLHHDILCILMYLKVFTSVKHVIIYWMDWTWDIYSSFLQN